MWIDVNEKMFRVRVSQLIIIDICLAISVMDIGLEKLEVNSFSHNKQTADLFKCRVYVIITVVGVLYNKHSPKNQPVSSIVTFDIQRTVTKKNSRFLNSVQSKAVHWNPSSTLCFATLNTSYQIEHTSNQTKGNRRKVR